uniref:Fatty acid hydroxylase domain-containing protein n=1 Tax=Quercus lobata TaxID=97700 RepID=A0A7N2KW50_QUELO
MVFWEGYVSDEAMGTFAPIVVYWLYAGFYQLLPPLENFRLHTRKEEDEKNSVPLSAVVKGVLLQQLVQATVAQALFLYMCDFMFNIGFLSHHAAKLRVESISLELKCRFTSVLRSLGFIERSTDKEACISDVLSHQEGNDVRFWNLRFYRDFEDWELAASFSLLDFVQAHLPRGVGSDFLCWGLNGNGKFDTRSFYNELRATPNSSSLGRAFGKQRRKTFSLFLVLGTELENKPNGADNIFRNVTYSTKPSQINSTPQMLTSKANASGITIQPSIPVQIVQIVVAMFVMDSWQYFVHRYMHHNKFLYRHIHSQHHRLVVPYAIGALYNHPLEGLLLDTFGGAISFLVSGMTARTAVFFFCFAVIKTVDDHCGLWLPGNIFHIVFQNNSAYHDIHHQLQGLKYNYSQPFFPIWDKLLGTHMPYNLVKRPEGGFEARAMKD